MNLFNSDPAFVLPVTLGRVIHKTGEFTDRETNKIQSYDSLNIQFSFESADGEISFGVAKPVSGYKPDISKLRGSCRLAVVSMSTSGGQTQVRFSGFESAK